MSLDIKNYLIYHIHDKNLKEYAQKYFKGKLLDIGCGEKPYEKLLSEFVDKHIGLDHIESIHSKKNIDLFGTAYDIPSGDEEFDSVLCSAVLEHLEEPEKALKECNRILRRNGIAIYSVPFIWHIHEAPRDFYRFSKYGLKYLFEKNGFEVLEMKALSGFWITFGVLFCYNIYRFNKPPLSWLFLIPIISVIVQFFIFFLDKIDKTEDWTWMYMVVVRKK
jgi:SAM-dependent methyltransferase